MTRLYTTALCALTFCALTGTAFAGMPALVPTQQQGGTFMLPKGWAVKSTAEPLATVVAEETAGSSKSPSLHYWSYPLTQGPNTAATHAAQVASSLQGGTLVSRQALPGGMVLEQWQGALGGVKASAALLYFADTTKGGGMTALFAAPPERYVTLGGANLLLATLGLSSPSTATVKTTTPAPRKTANVTAKGLSIPQPYASTNQPTLFYIAENLHALSPAQIAAGLRQFNSTEHQLIAIYSAFGNMLHGIACEADAKALIMSTSGPKNCRTTMAEWANTLQFTQGDKSRAFSYAFRQRDEYLIGRRCSDGTLSKSSCNTYIENKRNEITRNHNMMTRIIANFSNACVVGDAGCVPY